MSKKEYTVKEYNSKSILYIALMRHKKGILLVILIAMISSSLAWFYQNLSVGIRVNGEVESWNVSVGESSFYTFSFGDIKPGVNFEDPNKKIVINNKGTTDAQLNIEIKDIYLYGEKVDHSKYHVEKEDIEGSTTGGKEYTIYGFPFSVVMTFPQTRVEADEVTEIRFKLVWPLHGDLTPKEITQGEETITVPTCRTKILDRDILDYVDEQKAKYASMELLVDDDPTHSQTDFRITTCDIIDSYYGQKAVKFKEEKADLEIGPDDVFFVKEGDAEGEKHPVQAFFVELSMTVAQAGGHNIDIGNQQGE